MVNKKKDLQALEEINMILSNLPDDSYVRIALDGCQDFIEESIEQDCLYPIRERLCELIVENNYLKERLQNQLRLNEDYMERIETLRDSRDTYIKNCNYLIGEITRQEILISRYEERLKEMDR